MADNVDITPGAGATVATDDVGGVQYQKVKLDAGGDGATSPVTAANPLPVQDAALETVAGTQADAAVTGDAAGTLSAKLRGLSLILANVWDSINGWLKVGLSQYTPVSGRLPVDGSGVTQPTSDAVSQASLVGIQETTVLLRRLVKVCETLAVVDSNQRQRVTIDAGTLPAVTTVTTCSTVTTVNQLNGVDPRFLLIDTARTAYARGIRANLIWS